MVGYYVGTLLELQQTEAVITPSIYGTMIGLLVGLVLIFIEQRLRRVSLRGLSSIVFGLLLGIFMAKMIIKIMTLIPLSPFVLSVSELVITIIFSYLGAVMALRGKDEFNIVIPYVRFKRQDASDGAVLLDTSSIIDGRICDIYKSGFLSGRLIVVRSVLQELQQLADSNNDMKRQKGRRGMELLRNMQKDTTIEIKIHEDDITNATGVDGKLIALAKIMDASICTTDFNLGKIAAVQGINVLNINTLANSVKPIVFAGDMIEVKLVKEGKEQHQAVGYMDDGTMIVVSDANQYVGQTKNVVISSVLQTSAGKMIFAKLG
jgi:uncharacterized protein YacL